MLLNTNLTLSWLQCGGGDMRMKIIKKVDKVPPTAKCAGKLDCVCNQCGKKVFHYLYELNSRSFIKCIVHDEEVWEVKFINDKTA